MTAGKQCVFVLETKINKRAHAPGKSKLSNVPTLTDSAHCTSHNMDFH